MRRSRSVTFAGAVTAAVLTAAACSSNPPAAGQVCSDQRDVRVDDTNCDHESGSVYHWLYLPMNTHVPAVGERISGAQPRPPAGARVYRPARTGGVVSRGGFGSRFGGTTGG